MKTFLRKTTLAVALLSSVTGFSQTGYFGEFFTHTAATATITFNHSDISRPSIDANTSAPLIVTANWAPTSVYADYKFGVWHTGTNWSIYNEGGGSTTFADGSAWNVLVPSNNGTTFTHTATAGNTTGQYTVISNAALDGNPNAIFFITHNWSANGSGVYNNHNTGVWYTGTNWAIYNEDLAAFPENAAYTIFVPSSGNANAFKHTATLANISSQTTDIDNPLTNDQPNRVIFVTHNWEASGVYNDNPLGVWYTGSKWSIFNQNIAAMPENSVYNVLVVDEQGTAVKEQTANANFMSVFPNPAADNLTVGYVLTETSNVQLSIVNVMGQQVKAVYTGNQAKGNFTLNSNVADLAPGMYYYLLNVNGAQSRKTFIKN